MEQCIAMERWSERSAAAHRNGALVRTERSAAVQRNRGVAARNGAVQWLLGTVQWLVLGTEQCSATERCTEQALHGTERCTEQSAACMGHQSAAAVQRNRALQCSGTEYRPELGAARNGAAHHNGALATGRNGALYSKGTEHCPDRSQNGVLLRSECRSERSAARNGALLGTERCSLQCNGTEHCSKYSAGRLHLSRHPSLCPLQHMSLHLCYAVGVAASVTSNIKLNTVIRVQERTCS